MKAITQKHDAQIDTTERAEMIDSIVWFGLNYNYDFIERCWSDDPCLANHLKDKFAICTSGLEDQAFISRRTEIKTRISYGVMTRFLTMLDTANREKLYNYILKTYRYSKGWLTQD